MSQLRSASFSATNSAASSEIRLYERVRLQSFQGLLPGANNRMRSTGRYPHVLLEDLLKAEVISFQLILAIENVVKCVNQDFESENHGRKMGAERENSDEGSVRCFQNALVQSANALNELTKLQISENVCAENVQVTPDTLKPFDMSPIETPFFDGTNRISNQPPTLEKSNITTRLSYGSERTSLSEPSWNFSMRVSELTTAASDATSFSDSVLSSREGTEGKSKDDEIDIEGTMKDAIKTLRIEMEELQLKHEKQFVNYAAECLDLNQDENHNTREILEKIMGNLSPQDQNWAYQGKFDEPGMEQLFYFVLLQKTLKCCLATIDTVIMEERESMEEEPSNTQEMSQSSPTPPSYHRSQIYQQSLYPVPNIDGPHTSISDFNHLSMNNTCPTQGNMHTSNVELSEHTKTHGDNFVNNCKMNGKRMNEFEDERETKKQKKSIFGCFHARWQKKKKQKKHKDRE